MVLRRARWEQGGKLLNRQPKMVLRRAQWDQGGVGQPLGCYKKFSRILGEGLTRIALRKYTSFGDHLAVKHFGARPGIHPNINRFSVTLRLSISEPGLAYIQTSTVSASPCG